MPFYQAKRLIYERLIHEQAQPDPFCKSARRAKTDWSSRYSSTIKTGFNPGAVTHLIVE